MYFVQKIVENVEIFVENNNFPSLMLECEPSIFYPLVLHINRVGTLSFLFQVRVNIIAGINLAGLLLICIVIHGGMAIKVCISNCKIDFFDRAYYNMKNA